MNRTIVTSYYFELEFLRPIMISNRNLVKLLEKILWINSLVIEENVYINLVRLFFSNMVTSTKKRNQVITHVREVVIELGPSLLNDSLGTPNKDLEIYSAGKPLIYLIIPILMPFVTFIDLLTFLMSYTLFIFGLNVYVFNFMSCFRLLSLLG